MKNLWSSPTQELLIKAISVSHISIWNLFPPFSSSVLLSDLEQCEPGWDKFHGFCYRHFSQRLSWEVAEKHCRVLGAHLVSIMSHEEQSYINSRHYLMKLPVKDLWGAHSNVFVLLLSFAPGSPSPLSILVRASLCCSVKGIAHSIVWDVQYLGNFSHGITFISWNLESVIKPRIANAPDTKEAQLYCF